MFRTFSRNFLPNPLDRMLKRSLKRGKKRILLAWNRGLGDIPLGLYAVVQRIRTYIPDAEVTFLTRKELRDGFSLLEGVDVLAAPEWKRGEKIHVKRALQQLGRGVEEFDLIIEQPSPTDWVCWQLGSLTPRLKWEAVYDALWKRFNLPDGYTYVGVQLVAESAHGPWRNWPTEHWGQLFDRLEQVPNIKVVLFGFGDTPQFSHRNLIDLRGKTSLFELLSLLKNRCSHAVLPDSGILSTLYYLDVQFPIRVVSLWADKQGVLKQGVPSPNRELFHAPLFGASRDLSAVQPSEVLDQLFPPRPLKSCAMRAQKAQGSLEGVGAILLAGGEGSRLGVKGPKGTFQIGGKSLFQWICEKAPQEDFPIAVMTSPLNHDETVRFFSKNDFFNREILFFQQSMRPLLDAKKRELKRWAPDGNGALYRSFVISGLAELFLKRGIDLVMVVPVENPLADPADRTLIAHHRSSGAEVTVKCIERREEKSAMGALVEREGKLEITEYLYFDSSFSYTAVYTYVNTGMAALALSFLMRMASVQLPLHWVRKREFWKAEKFVFDAYPYAKKSTALCYPRQECYAPLKSLKDFERVEQLLQ